MHHLRILKYWSSPTYLPIGSHTSTVSEKNTTVINFAQSCVENRVSIRFSCTVSEF
ncbi:hypothetical protein GW17_00045148 [Ensete ventricosum]|nr:hypothetical protein GW17_00045148 [Ensete ventricosum]